MAVAYRAGAEPPPSRSPATKPNWPVPMLKPMRLADWPAYMAALSMTPRKVPANVKFWPRFLNRLAVIVIEPVTMPCLG